MHKNRQSTERYIQSSSMKNHFIENCHYYDPPYLDWGIYTWGQKFNHTILLEIFENWLRYNIQFFKSLRLTSTYVDYRGCLCSKLVYLDSIVKLLPRRCV